MFEYDLVRRLYYRDGLSKHEISRRTGLHRKTINKMLRYARPPGYRLSHPRPKTKLGSFLGIIDQILEDDQKAPPKPLLSEVCVFHIFLFNFVNATHY